MIELMRDRITIQKSSVKTDKIGNHVLLMPITCLEKNTGQQSS